MALHSHLTHPKPQTCSLSAKLHSLFWKIATCHRYSDFAKGMYRYGWFCDGVAPEHGKHAPPTWNCMNSRGVQIRKDSLGRSRPFHQSSERRFFCIHCGYNVCLACSGNNGHSNTVTCIDISADGSFAASTSEDSTCILWDMKRLRSNKPGKCKDPFSVCPLYKDVHTSTLKSPSAHSSAVDGVKISPDGNFLVTWSNSECMSVRYLPALCELLCPFLKTFICVEMRSCL